MTIEELKNFETKHCTLLSEYHKQGYDSGYRIGLITAYSESLKAAEEAQDITIITKILKLLKEVK